MRTNEDIPPPEHPSQLPPVPTTRPSEGDAQGDISRYLTKKKMEGGAGHNNLMMIIVFCAAGLLLLVFGLTHNKKPGVIGEQPAPVKKAVAAHKKTGYMPGDQEATPEDEDDKTDVTPQEIENTKNTGDVSYQNRTSQDAAGSGRESLGGLHGLMSADDGQANGRNPDVTPFNKSGTPTLRGVRRPVFPSGQSQSLNSVPPFAAPPYQPGMSAPANADTVRSSPEAARAYADEVSKPSLVFTAERDDKGSSHSKADNPSEPVISNFGLQTGFHVAAHLEASVSTVGGVPAVAIIEYDCMQNGKVVIPAGSRVIGKLSNASSTGLVNLTFSEIDMPDGARIPINAVGLDPYLHQIKGIVTGHHFLKELALGAVTSVGSLAAGFAANNNNGAISQMDLAREQMANNVGNSGDQIIQQMQVTQSLVVTVPSGTQVYVTFIAPVKNTQTSTSSSDQALK